LSSFTRRPGDSVRIPLVGLAQKVLEVSQLPVDGSRLNCPLGLLVSAPLQTETLEIRAWCGFQKLLNVGGQVKRPTFSGSAGKRFFQQNRKIEALARSAGSQGGSQAEPPPFAKGTPISIDGG